MRKFSRSSASAPIHRTRLSDGSAPSSLETALAETREASLAIRKKIALGFRCAISSPPHLGDKMCLAAHFGDCRSLCRRPQFPDFGRRHSDA
jgi:hypothetical protein